MMIYISADTESHISQAPASAKRDWVRPDVRRIAAGAAENGTPTGTPDVGVNFS